MSSVSGVGTSVVTPQVTTPPASQNSVAEKPAAQTDKSANAGAVSASSPANPPASNDTSPVQPSKPAGQGQVVYIST